MHEINYIDKSFNPELSGTYNLCLQVNYKGLTYAVYDEQQQLYLMFRKHRFNQVYLVSDLEEAINHAFRSDETLGCTFRGVRFIGYTRQTTLVPDCYFENEKMHDYLSFNHAGDIDHELFNNVLPQQNLRNIFALPPELISTVMRHFKKVEFMSQTTTFLRHAFCKTNNHAQPALHIGLNPEFFDIAYIKDDALQLYNTFQYTGENDLLYYLLFVCKQLGIDTAATPLYLSGEYIAKLTYFETLKRYVPLTSYAAVSGIPLLAHGLRQLNPVRFVNLLNIQLCASSEENTGVAE